MADTTIDNRTLVRRTLITASVMLGACVVLVGTLTLVASAIVGHVVASSDEETGDGGGSASVASARGTPPGARAPMSNTQTAPK
jgi:hypothetical protein